ncbi:MAG: hypothetical protein H0T08_07340 [Acidobacteria bacterium]|jgi:hypothetical protein|nr:hypothetical protein [Acidobacteriota bacterium]
MQKNIGKNKKKQTSKPEKPVVATNKPPDILLEFIKHANLVPFDADFSFGLPDNPFGEGVSFLSWADEHNLRQYSKLFRHLLDVEKKPGFWQVTFTEIKKNREFMKLLVEITEKFQKELERERKELERERERERIMRLGVQAQRELGIKHPKNYISPKRKRNFKITTEKTFLSDIAFLGETKIKKNENPELAKRLANIASDFFSLTLDENYRGNLSLGVFSDVIEDTDFRRLKKCIVCSDIFWAYRLNTKFCQKKCSNQYHQKEIIKDPKRKDVVNARRSKTRFDKQVAEAQKMLRNAKTNLHKVEAKKKLQSAISKRTAAAQKLNDLKFTPGEK